MDSSIEDFCKEIEIWESEKEQVISLVKAIRLAAECKTVEE